MKTRLLSQLTAALAASLVFVSSARAQGGNTRPTTPTNPIAPINPGGGGGGIIGILPIIPGGGGGSTSNTPVIVSAQGVLVGEPAQASVVIPTQIAAGGDTGATGLAYQWTISGGRIVSATNTQVITYVADTAGTVTLNATITSNGSTATASVTAISPATAGAMTVPSTTVMSTGATGATITATVPAAVNSDRTFRWTVTGDAAIVGAATNNTVTLRAGTAGLKQVNCAVTLQRLVTVDLTSFLVVTGNGPEVAVTVNGGSGGGTWRGGSRIDILADPPPAGQVFDRWTGDVSAFNGANANNTALLSQIAHQVVNVPATPVTLTATYKPAPAWRTTTIANFNPQQQTATQPVAGVAAPATVVTTLQHYVPASPSGLVFLLHDRGGISGDWFQRPQQILLVRDLVAAGYGVAALNSVNRNAGTWATQTTLATNLDALNHHAAITRLIADGAITATTPVFLLGLGEGGNLGARYADLLATGVAAQGTAPAISARNVKGAVLFCTTGIEALAVASKVPQFFALAANDDSLGNAGLNTARTNSQLLTGRGLATGFVNSTASPVFANRFLALGLTGTAVAAADAQAIHTALRTAKLLDDNSYAKAVPTVETVRTALPAAYQDRTADVRAEIGVAYAAGQFFADANARVINFLNGRVANAPTPAPGRLVNLSTRTVITSVGDTFALGFNISGTERATLLIRGIGPALRAFGLSTALAAPRLELNNASGTLLAANEGWERQPAGGATAQQVAQAAAAVGAFALTAGSNDAALVVQLPPGTYTVALKGVNGVIGDVLAEVYDVSRNGTRLTNLSTLARIADEGESIVPGIVVAGNNPRTLLVRAVGPGLTAFGLGSAELLGDPRLTVLNGNTTVTTNNNWSQAVGAAGSQAAALTAAFPAVGAFALTASSADSALVSALAPAAYTIRADAAPFVTNPNNQQAVIQPNPTGRVLVEIYEVP
ncbi:MAG: hypothetical protein HZA93_00945 [Verrucomicrobia bacterium]|nr:hypothetical protein [Verrucomicrobiota bacterium]